MLTEGKDITTDVLGVTRDPRDAHDALMFGRRFTSAWVGVPVTDSKESVLHE